MSTCTRNGCGQIYTEQRNSEMSCQYHPGQPKFHEGLKGWTCCEPRVHSFDEFLELKGCTLGLHSKEPKHKDDPFKADLTKHDDVLPAEVPTPAPASVESQTPAKTAQELPPAIDEDPEGTVVAKGAGCKRNGCNAAFVSEEESHGMDQCQFHPGQAVFHEGNKGWSCCKPRVTDFDEFMEIAGCHRGRHMFVGTQSAIEQKKQQATKCRRDFYQSGSQVIASIYAKKINRETSSIVIGPQSIKIHLVYGGDAVYDDEIELFGEVDPETSTFEYLSTKVEITLAKQASGQWSSLEK